MKKLLMAVAAFGMLLTSCAKDDTVAPVEDKEALVSFCVNSPAVATRYGEGEKATTLYWAVYDNVNGRLTDLQGSKEIKLSTTVDLKLIQGREYKVLFWAADAQAPYTVDWDAKTMTVSDVLTANKEEYDAFFKYEDLGAVNGAISRTIELRRPFAQLNIGTADTTEAEMAKFAVSQTEVTVEKIYNTLNFVDGSVSGEVSTTFALAAKANGTISANDKSYDHIAMNYLLVGDKKLVNVTLNINDEVERKYTSVPVQRNYRTNIVGNILTSPAEFNVVILPGFTEPAYEGFFLDENGTTAIVSTTIGLKELAEKINNGEISNDIDISLNDDIDLSLTTSRSASSNWTPIGTPEVPYTGTFNGGGYTIKNLNIVVTEGKEDKAYIGFFGYAKNATIKNVIFENVNLNIACLDIDHSQGHIGAVAGSLEGTSTIEDVTVKGDVKVEATFDANGASRVAAVVGGNLGGNVTMKNVHVKANAGSYVKANNNAGGLAGQLQVKNVFENCSSNIDVTVKKFFAGGIIGIAAGDSKFTNCHTTGNYTVTGGREGNKNDHFRVGGIAAGWADGSKNVCTLVNCSYTGTLSGTNSDGSVADVFDCAGYVGRGYGAIVGAKVSIDGVVYTYEGNGVYSVDGVRELNVRNIEELQAALDSEESVTINFLTDIAGEAWLAQKDDVNVTINGNGKKYDGEIKIHGNSGYRSGITTIKNVNFETQDASVNFVYAVDFGSAKRYSNNINVENCTFTAVAGSAAEKTSVGVQVNATKNLVVKGCTATNMHSLLQAQSCDSSVVVDGAAVSGGKNGVSFGNTAYPTLKNSNITAAEYGVRADGNASRGNLVVEKTTITANQGIVVRKVTSDGYAVNLGEGVEINTGELYDVVFTKGSDDVAYVAPTVKYTYSSVNDFVVFPDKVTVYNAGELAAAIAAVNTVYLGVGNFGTIVAVSGKTYIATSADAKVDCVNLNGADNVTLKNITFDAATAQMAYDGKGNERFNASILSGAANKNAKGSRNLVIDGCTFTGTYTNGGTTIAFNDQGRGTGQSGDITIKNCTFATEGGYVDIYTYYSGYGDMKIENNTFNSVVVDRPIYIGRYQSNTPVVVKGNKFKKVATFEAATYIQKHSDEYTVSFDASNNTFAN